MGRFILDIPDDILAKWTKRMFGKAETPENEILRRLSGGLNFDIDVKDRIVVVKEP